MDHLRAKVKAEVQRRITARAADSLEEFIKLYWSIVDPAPFKLGRHLGLVCERLEAVTAGEIAKLMINVPPGHQKSLTVSVFWPAWVWINQPGKRFLFTSHRGDLALRDADRTRELIRSQEYQSRYGGSYSLRFGQDTKGRYENTQKGYRYSTSVSGIMGEGGDFVVLDDPHNVEQAESDDVRKETVRKIRLALPSRVRSNDGGTVCMMQRLHETDFAGVVLSEEKDQWHHLCLPEEFEHDHPSRTRETVLPSGRVLRGDWRTEDGELLFPELFPRSRVEELRDAVTEYGFAGQYQQRPAPRSGGLFDPDNWEIIPALPKERATLVVRAWDFAGTEPPKGSTPKGAWTVGVRMWKIGSGYYIDDVVRFQGKPAKVEEKLKATAKRDGRKVVIDIPQDPGQAGKFQVRHLVGLLTGFSVFHSPEVGSKAHRADPYAAQQEVGNVYLVGSPTDPWIRQFINSHALFPAGEAVDEIDAASRAFRRCNVGVVRTGTTTGGR